ncbi:MAG: glycosyltransferase [Thermodesulfobacteriota bacterium]
MPLISVIIPTWNRVDFLATAIDSVLSQNFQDFELIVVDDGSTDATPELLASHGRRLTTLATGGNQQGPAAARNLGIKAATGEFIAFLDSDDWWQPGKLASQYEAMAKNPHYLISHTDEIWYRRGALLNQKKKHGRPHGFIFARCLPLCCVGMSTVMTHRDFFEQVGTFNEELPCCEDYELWLRAAARLPFLKVAEPLTCKEGGRDDQVSVRFRLGMDRFRIKALLESFLSTRLSARQRGLVLAELIRKAEIYGSGCRRHGRAGEGDVYLSLAKGLACGREPEADLVAAVCAADFQPLP